MGATNHLHQRNERNRHAAGQHYENINDPLEELKRVERVVAARRLRRDPVAWVHEKLGGELWSKQQHIMRRLVENRRVAVPSCHGAGKSHMAASACCWWLDSLPAGKAFVVTSAPTVNQVKAILWREIGRVHALGHLRGRLNQTEWHDTVNGREELVAFGRKPDEYDPDAFQGIHAPFVLVVIDEANGVRGSLWDAADSLISNDNSKMLVIGNPDDPTGEFFNLCKPGSGWVVEHISAFDSPNFTGEPLDEDIKDQLIGHIYVEERRRKWAHRWRWVDAAGQDCEWRVGARCVPPDGESDLETAPFWQSKVLGRFPMLAEDVTLIPMQWIERAQKKTINPGLPSELGHDVGGGGDASVIAWRRGGHVRIVRSDRNPDTMQTCGNLMAAMMDTGATLAKIDMIGIGHGVYDRAREQGRNVVGINVGEAADDEERFANRRAELYWSVRDLFERDEVDLDPTDDDLANELGSIRFKRTSAGKIQIETKDEAHRRGVPSPNRADAVMLALGGNRKKRIWSAVW